MNTKINVVFRSCDAVNAVHNSPRPFELEKKTLIKICFKSLYNSLQGFDYKIVVLGDNLSQELKEFFLQFDLDLVEGVFGNENSIREAIKISKNFNDNEWVYFCEDDYLHQQDAIEKIVELINEKEVLIPSKISFKQRLRKREITLFSFPRFFSKPNIVIFPCDYPDRYNLKYLEKNFIFQTSNSHWRQVCDTTFTFLMQAKDVKRKGKILMYSANRANDRYLSEKLYGKTFFFNKLLCLSPLPSLSSHMHTQTMSPIVDWKNMVDNLLKEVL